MNAFEIRRALALAEKRQLKAAEERHTLASLLHNIEQACQHSWTDPKLKGLSVHRSCVECGMSQSSTLGRAFR